MRVRRPRYFDEFHCIAGACPDSCCKDWLVDIDEKTLAYYERLPGELGERVRAYLQQEEGVSYFRLENGHCPLWNGEGLCDLQMAWGDSYISHTCREFPRLRHDYGYFVEFGLDLSCPAAARLILQGDATPITRHTAYAPETAPDFFPEDMDALEKSRKKVLDFLKKSSYSLPETLAILLMYAYSCQGAASFMEVPRLYPKQELADARCFAKEGDIQALVDFFAGLERLQPVWTARLEAPEGGGWDARTRNLLRYFVERYWLQSISDYELVSRVKFMVASCLLLKHLGGDFPETAQKFSKEVESSPENMDALLDAAYSHPAFRDEALLGLLLA